MSPFVLLPKKRWLSRDGRSAGWFLLLILFLLLAAGACTPVKSKRPDTSVMGGNGALPCGVEVAHLSAEQIRNLDPGCQQAAMERSKELDYALHVVEFDDEGRYFPPAGEPDALSQAELVKRRIREELRNDGSAGISVVVMVHGWKHSAAMDDPNIVTFRDVLGQLAAVEKRTHCNRKVIGVYVGWRGRNAPFGGPLENTTFWSRKAAAERVANGQIKQLFGDLRALQDTAAPRYQAPLIMPTPEEAAAAEEGNEFDCASRMKMTYLGHSFGGLIVTNATLPTLVRELSESHEREDLRAWCDQKREASAACDMLETPLPVPDELVIVVNPAVESSRFYPLYAAAQESKHKDAYRAPRFVSITSDKDLATGMAFPWARFLNAATKAYPTGDTTGRQSERLAMGHDPNFITHFLSSPDEAARGGKAGGLLQKRCVDGPSPALRKEMPGLSSTSVQQSPAATALDRTPLRILDPVRGYPRLFEVRICPEPSEQNEDLRVDLDLVPYDKSISQDGHLDASIANTEVWNVLTTSPVVNDHNDFSNRRLLDFLGLLYLESMTRTSVGQKSLNRVPSSVSK